jgi:hypothetical protein
VDSPEMSGILRWPARLIGEIDGIADAPYSAGVDDPGEVNAMIVAQSIRRRAITSGRA